MLKPHGSTQNSKRWYHIGRINLNRLTEETNKINSASELFFDNRIGENLTTSMPEHFGNDYFLSPESAASFLDVSRKFIYELIARGELKALTVGGRLRRIRRSDLESWLASSNKGEQT